MTALLELEDVEARYGPVHVLHGSLARGRGGDDRRRPRPERRRQDDDASGRLGNRPPLRPDRVQRQARSAVPAPTARRGSASPTSPKAAARSRSSRVWENLRLGAYTRRGSIKSDVERVLTYFPVLADRRRQQAGTLSGGEQQMLALARAFVQRPKLLLLDEPSLGLAPVLVAEIFRIVRELNEKEGLTVLVVEQNAHLALQAAQTGYVLEAGKIVLSGTSEELQADDAIRASYLGY